MQFTEALIVLFYMLFDGAEILNLVRTTRYGLIRGSLERSRSDPTVEYFSFRGVPYAQPPLGKLRFQEPIPPEPWFDIKSATEAAVPCVQFTGYINGYIIGNEDCLYLDVYVPRAISHHTNGLLPVMVWIHGGAFVFGTSNTTGPDYLMEKAVVIVEVQYRLNVFGFLSTLDKYAKGNLGLKDQQLALQWVQNNIANFGGDPNSVTIFGESAGGASVLYHMLAPRSQGLFHKAISESGSTLNKWALQQYPKEMTLRLARGLGIKDTDSKTIITQLQKLDYATIITAAFNMSVVGFYIDYYTLPFIPIIESESADTAFISESSFSLLQKGKYSRIPYIIGFNTEEGATDYNEVLNGRVDITIYERYPQLLIPASMNIPKDSECYYFVLDRIIAYYFPDGHLTNVVNWIKYMTQDLFLRGIVKTMELMYKNIPVYFYRFSYTGSRPMSFIGGVGHMEEIQYLLYPAAPGSNPVESESDRLTRRRLVTMWTNFAYTGNPTPFEDELLQNVAWPEAYPNKAYLDIGSNLTIHQNPNQEDSEFWEYLFNLCGNPPYDTY